MRTLALLLLVVAFFVRTGALSLAASAAPAPPHLSCAAVIARLKDPRFAAQAKGAGDLLCIDGPIADVKFAPPHGRGTNAGNEHYFLNYGDSVSIRGCSRPGPHPVVTVLSIENVLAGKAPEPSDEVSCASKTFTAHRPESPPSPFVAMFKRFAAVILGLFNDHTLSLTTDVSRGAEAARLRSSSLSNPQFIPQTLDRISIGWAGGTPPFRVVLSSPRGAVATQVVTSGRSLMNIPVGLSAKRIEVTIVDGSGSRIDCAIERSKEPPHVPWASSSEWNAASLLRYKNRHWRLYAYTLIAPDRATNVVASLLAGRLSGEY